MLRALPRTISLPRPRLSPPRSSLSHARSAPRLPAYTRTMATQTDKPIVLYTFPTPNGVVPAILLEELKVCPTRRSGRRVRAQLFPSRRRMADLTGSEYPRIYPPISMVVLAGQKSTLPAFCRTIACNCAPLRAVARNCRHFDQKEPHIARRRAQLQGDIVLKPWSSPSDSTPSREIARDGSPLRLMQLQS